MSGCKNCGEPLDVLDGTMHPYLCHRCNELWETFGYCGLFDRHVCLDNGPVLEGASFEGDGPTVTAPSPSTEQDVTNESE